MGPEMGPEMGGDVGCVTMRLEPTCEVCRPLTCTNALCRWGTGRAVSAGFGVFELLRIRRLGVRIPSGAHCVETVDEALTSGNAGRGLVLCAFAPRTVRVIDSNADGNRPARARRSPSEHPIEASAAARSEDGMTCP